MDIQNKIYDECLNINMDFADKINTYIDELLDEQRDKYINEINKLNQGINKLNQGINKLNQDVNNLNQNMNNLTQELNKEKENSKYYAIIRKSSYVIRQYLNYKFRALWDELPENIKNKYDPSLGSKLKRKHVLENDGVKYALLILNDIHKGTTKNLCNYYLDLNDTFHPNFRPENIIVHNYIEDLKKIPINISIDIQILNEIDNLCLK